MNNNTQENSKIEVEARIHQILLEYLGAFEKEGVAAVVLPPKQKEGKEGDNAGTPPKENEKGVEVEKEEEGKTSEVLDKEEDSEMTPSEKVVKVEDEQKIEGETTNRDSNNDDDDDDEIKEGVTITIKMEDEEEITKGPDQKQKAPSETIKKPISEKEIINYYSTNAEKLNTIIKSTIKTTNDLWSALQDFIIFVDTIKDSEVTNFKTARGPEIVSAITAIGTTLLGPNKAQVGVSFVYMMFKLILQEMMDFLGVDENTMKMCKKAFEFNPEDFMSQSKFVILLGFTLSEILEAKEEENKKFYRDVRFLLRDHFNRENIRNIEGIEVNTLCEELIYYGITFNFYDAQVFTIVTMTEKADEDGKENTKCSNPMKEYFTKLAIPLNTRSAEIIPSEIVLILKKLTIKMMMETAAMLPREIYFIILGLNSTNPRHFFSTHELFKFVFVPEDENLVLFDLGEEEETNLIGWILVLGTLTQKDIYFKNNLIQVTLKALTSPKIPFKQIEENLGKTKMDVLEGYEDDVKNIVDNFRVIVRETIKSNLSEIEPRYLIGIPKAIFEDEKFQDEIENISFADKRAYFDVFFLKLTDQKVVIQVIDRLLGNKKPCKSPIDICKILKPIQTWSRNERRTFQEFTDFIFNCTRCVEYSSRLTEINDAALGDIFYISLYNIQDFINSYDSIKKRERSILELPEPGSIVFYKALMGTFAEKIARMTFTYPENFMKIFNSIAEAVSSSDKKREGKDEKEIFIPELYKNFIELGAAFIERKVLETKWFSLSNMNLSGLLFFEANHKKEGSWGGNAKKIRAKLVKESELIKGEKITFSLAQLFYKNGREVENLFKSWGISGISARNLETFFSMFKEVKVAAGNILKVAQWIKSSGFKIEANPFTEETTLQEMRSTGEYIVKTMSQAGVRLDELSYFVNNNSDMFMGKLKDLSGEAIESGKIGNDLKYTNTILDTTYAFFKRFLVFEQLTFGEFDKIDELMKRHEREFDRELKVISESKGIDVSGTLNKKVALEYLSQGMKLRTLVEGCKNMVAFMNNMEIGDKKEKQKFEMTLNKFGDNMPIIAGPDLIKEIRGYVGEISDFQTEVFGTIHKCTDVVTFIMSIWKDFDTQTQFVTGQHGSDFETELINALRHVKTIMSFVEQGISSKVPMPIFRFCDEAKKFIPTSMNEMERLSNNLVSIFDHLTMIRVWYMTISSTSVDADNLIPFLSDVLQSGEFWGKLPRQGEATLCLVKRRDDKIISEYGPKFVQEFVRGLKIFLGKKGKGKNTNAATEANMETLLAERFVELTESAGEAFKVVEELRDMGHPKYQVESVSVGGVLSEDVEQCPDEKKSEWELRIIQKGLDTMKRLQFMYHEDERLWNETMKSTIESENRIVFFDNAQLLRFWHSIIEFRLYLKKLENGKEQTSGEIERTIMHFIYPYIWICFPDYYKSLSARLNSMTLRKKIMDVVERIPGNININETNHEFMIDIIKRILYDAGYIAMKSKSTKSSIRRAQGNSGEGEGEEEEDDSGETSERILRYVLEKPWNTPNDVYMCMSHKIFNERVHPSCTFKCTERTSVERLYSFLKRVKLFPKLHFVLMNVNELGTRVKEALLRWVNERFEAGQMMGHLHMIFTEEYGTEMFNFVKMVEPEGEPGSEDRWGQPLDMAPKKTSRETWPNIIGVQIYDGEPLSGKTELALEDVKKFIGYHPTRKTSISVTEDFTPGEAGNYIKRDLFDQETLFPDTAVYLNVSPYAPLEEFGVFMYNLLAWGIVSDQRTGEVIHMYSKLKLNIFLEIGTAPEGDSECEFTDANAVISMIPLIRSFRPKFSHEKIKYKFSEDAKVCATVMNALNVSKIDYGPFYGKANPSVTFVTDGNHKDFVSFTGWLSTLSPSLAIQGRIVKILSERYLSLINYVKQIKEGKVKSFRKYLSFRELIMNAFTEEIMQYTHYPLGNIERFTYFPPDGSEPAVMDFSEGSHSEQPVESKTVKCLRFVSLDQVCQSLDELYTLIGGAFRVPIERCRTLLEGRGYVLTPDFAMKLMYLNTCRNSSQNVVFSGDTGTGKSELLEVFSQLINLGSPVIPRPLELLLEAFKDKVTNRNAGRYDFVGAIEDLCESTSTFPEIRDRVAAFVNKYLKDYKLVDPTPDMIQASEAFASRRVAECLVRKEHVLQVLQDILRGRLRDIFHRIQMHQHIYPQEFRERVGAVVKSAELVAGNKVTIIGFIDECTSTSIMGMVKEVLIDNTIDGKKLPNNIMWIGALNRNKEASGFTMSSSVSAMSLSASSSSLSSSSSGSYSEDSDDEMDGEKAQITSTKKEILDFTGIEGNKEKRDFAVRPPPTSFEMLEIQFSPMSGKQQRYFLRNLLKLRTDLSLRADHDSGEFDEIERAISFAHEFVREKNIPRVHPSIRDLVRCINLYAYFRRHHAEYGSEWSYFPDDLSASTTGTRAHVFSLVLAIAISYYFRVIPEYRAEFSRRYEEEGLPSISNGVRECGGDVILATFKRAALQLYNNTAFREGIAATDSFLENLFCTVVCIDAKVPLMVVGPPGCSKTLSFSIAMKNMRGRHSVSDFYKTLSCVHPLRYQCSTESVDTEIQAVYDNAITRQHSFDTAAEEGKSNNIEHQRVVVLLDEAGLPDEDKAPLKILHYVLDHPQVSTIILSNTILDAAKTNRTALLIQMAPENDDLYRLVQTCVYGDNSETTTANTVAAAGATLRKDQMATVRALAKAYKEILERQGVTEGETIVPVCEFFHLRDFVYLLRYLGRIEAKHGDITSPQTLTMALRRNFGGVNEKRFRMIVGIFIDAMAQEIPGYNLPNEADLEELLNRNSIVEALRESLAEKIERLEDPNTAPYRYILLIDPSDSELAISLLFDMGLCERDKTDIVHIPDFTFNDGSGENELNGRIGSSAWQRTKTKEDRAKEDAIIRMKDAMEDDDGKTVVLVNAMEISSSFYDVFNRHFDVLNTVGKDGTTHYKYFANVAVGSLSQPCPVSPDFRAIVHLPMSAIRRTPAPFLNRFEKYYMSLETIYNGHTNKMRRTDPKLYNAVDGLRTGVNDMVTHFHGKSFFYGIVPDETVTSLILPITEALVDQDKSGSKVSLDATARISALIPPIFHPNKTKPVKTTTATGGPTEATGENVPEQLKQVRRLNYQLFQLARPECVFSRLDIPDWYKREYLVSQEHFSIRRLIRGVFKAADGKFSDEESTHADFRKWCIFTRTCGELSRIHEHKKVRELLLNWEGKGDPDTWSDVIALETIASSEECNAKIDKFLDNPEKSVFVCTANISKVSADHINLVRSRINSDFGCEDADSKRIAFVILHFPPEIQHLQNVSSSQAVFFNKWNFSYVDTLGVYANTEREGIIEGEEFEDHAADADGDIDMGAEEEEDAGERSLDARSWLGYAYGIKEINQEKVLALFKKEIIKEGKTLIGRTSVGGAKIPKNLLPLTKDYYGNYRAKFKQPFGTLVEKQAESVFTNFFNYIVDVWYKLVKDIVKSDCNAVMSGARSSGLLCHLDSSLKRIYVPAAKGLTEMISSNYTLEAIFYAFKKGRKDAAAGCPDKEIALMRAVIDALPPFSTDDIMRSPSSSGAAFGQRGVVIERTQSTPAYLPFFNTIFKRVKELARAAKILAQKSSYEAAAAVLERLIDESNIRGIVDMIFSDEYLSTLYKRDFVLWGLGLPDLYVTRSALEKNPGSSIWLDKCVQCIDSLTSGHANKLAYIHFVPDFFQREVYRVSSAITPLLRLDPLPKSLELMDKISEFGNPNELTRAIVLSDIRILYKFLVSSGNDEEGKDVRDPSEKGRALMLFAQTFKEIRTFAPRKSAVKFIIKSPNDLALLNLETIIYYFVLHATQYDSVEQAKTYDEYNEKVFEELAQAVLAHVHGFNFNNTTMYEGIAFALELIKDVKMSLERGHAFISNVVLYYLEYNADEREVIPNDILSDVKLLIENCQNILPKMWTLQFLGRWLEAKPIGWGTHVLNIFTGYKPRFSQLDVMNPNYTTMDSKSFMYYHLLLMQTKRVLAAMKYEGAGNFKVGLLRKKFDFLKSPSQNIVEFAVKSSLLLNLFATEVVSTVMTDDAACEALNSVGIAEALVFIFKNRALINADVYFFSSFQDETFVQRICRWKNFVHTIGLETYYIQISQDGEGLFLPPYVINPEEPLFRPYHDLEEAVSKTNSTGNPAPLVNMARRLGTNDFMKRAIKMMLIIIFYYSYFTSDTRMSPAIERAIDELSGALDIFDDEKVVLKFFTKGLLRIEDPRIDPLLAEFSVKGREDSDNMYSHLMANVISFTLGCRRTSTHMYERAFDIPALNDNYGPGSGYRRYNWDCGYRIGPDGKFEWGVSPPIMHENRAYRLALNSITWVAICWSQITNPVKNFKAAISNHHFINCLGDEKKRFGSHMRTDEEAVHAYLFARGTTFFYEFSTNQDYIDKNINMLHFLNESLMELWRLDNSPAPPPDLIGHHTTDMMAYNYENIFEDIFNRVNANYGVLKGKLLDNILRSNEKLKKIFEIKAKCGLNLKNPFVDMQFFEDYVSKDSETDPACGLIKQFLLNRNKFGVLRKTPIVVEFYLELYKALDFRITDEDLNTLTIGSLLERPGTDRLKALWPIFEPAWMEVREGVKSEECAAAQAFEQEVAVISTEMPFIGRILTIPDLDEESGGGELFRIIENGLSPLQDKILTKRDVMGDDNAGMWNQYELGFKTPTKKDEALALESLTDNEVGYAKLITGETYKDELALVVGCNMSTDDTLSRNSVKFDTNAIARQIMYRYTGGRLPINPQGYLKEHFKRPCHLLSVGAEDSARSVTSDTKDVELLRTALIESFNPLHGINSLRIFVHKYKQLRFNSESNELAKTGLDGFNVELDGGQLAALDRNVLRIFGARNQEEVSEEQTEEWFASIAGILAAVLRYVVVNVGAGRDMRNLFKQSIADIYKLKVSGNEVPRQLDFMTNRAGRGLWSASHLVPIATELLDIVDTKRYMFEDVAPHFKVNFPESLARTMENLRKRVLETKDIEQREATAEIIDVLFQVLSNRSVLAEAKLMRMLYDKRLRSTFSDADRTVAESLLPVTLKSTYYASYMRWLCKLLADMRWSIYRDTEDLEQDAKGAESNTEMARRRTKIYTESIPEKQSIATSLSSNSVSIDNDDDDEDIVIIKSLGSSTNSASVEEETKEEQEEEKSLPEKRPRHEEIEVVVDGGSPEYYPLTATLEELIQKYVGAENAKVLTLVMEDTLNQPPPKYTLYAIAKSLGLQALRLKKAEVKNLISLFVYPSERIEERRARSYPLAYSSMVNRSSGMKDIFEFVKKLAPELKATKSWYLWGYILEHNPPEHRFEISNSVANVISTFYNLSYLEVVAFKQ